jgi:AraC-like DNA-binding protein
MSVAQWKSAARLLDVLARLIGQALSCPRRVTGPQDPPAIAVAKRFVEQHLEERITTSHLARAAGLNTSYFCRLFHRVTGQTPHAYIAGVRVEAAKAALRTSTQSISEIGYVAGFQSVSDFTRVFKARVGVTPSDFRRTDGATAQHRV